MLITSLNVASGFFSGIGWRRTCDTSVQDYISGLLSQAHLQPVVWAEVAQAGGPHRVVSKS